jgi:hypothetical protein
VTKNTMFSTTSAMNFFLHLIKTAIVRVGNQALASSKANLGAVSVN